MSVYRCVLNWFGDWSNGALYQVGREFTNKIDLEKANVSYFNVCMFSPCIAITKDPSKMLRHKIILKLKLSVNLWIQKMAKIAIRSGFVVCVGETCDLSVDIYNGYGHCCKSAYAGLIQ